MEFIYENKSIYYGVIGDGPVVVFVHGYMETSHMWQFLTSQLFGSCRVLTLDLPGHGQSENLDEDLTMNAMADLIKSLLDSLAIKEAAFCGHSMGGYVSLAFANLYPKMVRKLVLYHSSAFADSEQTKEKRKMGVIMLQEKPKTSIKVSMANLFYAHAGFEEQIAFYTEEALKGDVEAYISCNKGMAAREDLGEVLYYPRPTYFIAGRKDPVVPENVSQQQMDFLGPNDSFWLEKSGHMSYVEEMDLARSILLAILP